MAVSPPPFAAPMVPAPPSSSATPTVKTDAAPLSQALAFAAWAVAFAALGIRSNDPVVFVAAAAALALGIAVSIGTDVRRFLRSTPGVALAIAAMLALTVVWAVAESRSWSFPYAVVPLVGLAVLGADWAWVERLRPLVVVSGLGFAVLLDVDLASALVLALVWFTIAAAALWSLQRDNRRALPTPTPIGGAGPQRVDPSARELATIAGASIAVGLVLTLLISMIHLELDGSKDDGRPGGRTLPGATGGSGSASGGAGSGSGSASGGSGSGGSGSGGSGSGGSGSGSGGSGTASGGSGSGGGGGVLGGVGDRDGDGVIGASDGAVLDRNGDGIIDGRDTTAPVDTNGDGVLDGDDGYVFLDANDDGIIDERDAGPVTDPDGDGTADDPSPPDRNGDGVIDRNDVPVLSDTNDDGVIDRRDVIVVEDLDGNGTVDAGDVGRAADRNGDGVVDARDDLDIIDANRDGAVDDGELLDTLDRDGDGTIDRDEALVLDQDGDGRLDRSEIEDLPLSGEQGRQLDERRQEMETEDLTRTLLVALGVLVLLAAAVVAAIAIRRRLARRQERAERDGALILVERLEAAGAERGRRRRRNEPISHYAAALGAGELADPRLAEVGLLISAALFGPTAPDDGSLAWATQVIDDAVAAHPLPTRADRRRDRREERRGPRPGDPVPVGAGVDRPS